MNAVEDIDVKEILTSAPCEAKAIKKLAYFLVDAFANEDKLLILEKLFNFDR